MSMGFGQQQFQTAQLGQKALAIQATKQQQLALQKAELDYQAELEEEELDDDPEDAEPPEEEAAGDSDRSVGDDQSVVPFDREGNSGLRRLKDLPARARPVVGYRIDKKFEVHHVGGPKNVVRQAIARGIARHLESSGCRLEQPEDWCHIPRLESDELWLLAVAEADRPLLTELFELQKLGDKTNSQREKQIRDELSSDAQEIDNALRKFGPAVRAFAVLLPNREVIAVDVLVAHNTEASKKKHATRAGALRLLFKQPRPGQVADEQWTDEDWEKFQTSQRKRRNENKKKREQQLQPGD